jgi:hypothetical protein
MTRISPFGRYRALDANGDPLAGGKLYTYEAGTSTPKTTFTDNSGNTANPNPTILDADGYADVWLDVGGYKFTLTDADDVTLWTVDNIDGGTDSGFASTVISRSSSFALTVNEQGNVIICTAALTVSLLAAAIAGNGFSVMLINTGSGNVTIDPDGSETINGAASLVIGAGDSVSIHSDGIEWYAGEGNILDNSLPPAKITFSATDRLLGRATAGAGAGEEIVCTAFARTVLDDADAATARTTLGVVSASTSAAGLVELATAAETQAGSDTVRAVTPQALRDTVMGMASGQAWQVVTGSRAFSTNYTNSTGRPIQVVITWQSATGSTTMTATIGGVGVIVSQNANLAGANAVASFIVQAGAVYNVTTSSASTLNSWAELR